MVVKRERTEKVLGMKVGIDGVGMGTEEGIGTGRLLGKYSDECN